MRFAAAAKIYSYYAQISQAHSPGSGKLKLSRYAASATASAEASAGEAENRKIK
jgi:hypothetical protein